MPRRDGTGPEGRGPLSGRGRGFCITTRDKINESFGFGRPRRQFLRQRRRSRLQGFVDNFLPARKK